MKRWWDLLRLHPHLTLSRLSPDQHVAVRQDLDPGLRASVAKRISEGWVFVVLPDGVDLKTWERTTDSILVCLTDGQEAIVPARPGIWVV